MFLSDQSLRNRTHRFGTAMSASSLQWPPPTPAQRIARWGERSEMLGALSVLVFWAFGVGILLGAGAIVMGVFTLRRLRRDPSSPLPGDAVVGLITGIIGLALSASFFVGILPHL